MAKIKRGTGANNVKLAVFSHDGVYKFFSVPEKLVDSLTQYTTTGLINELREMNYDYDVDEYPPSHRCSLESFMCMFARDGWRVLEE